MEDECDDVLVERVVDENVVNDMLSVEQVTLGGDGVVPNMPEVGMTFNDEKELWDFYKGYAYHVGFPVKRRNSKKGDDGKIKYVTYTCGREGRRSISTSGSSKPQPTTQMDCKARITACSDALGIWRINTVLLEHNHKTSPSKSRLYRCNRELSSHVKRQLEVNDIAGIPLHKSFNSAVVEAGGYESMTCVEKDCRNYIEQVRRLRLGEGDAVAIQAYFSKMQSQCSGFYFTMDVDDEGRLKNVFWADNRSRQAYKEFGDVVTFDTTYLTNKYDMPFAPFVGVNHHGQSTLLGCGLLSNEDTETFVWLFRTWLQCMHGKAPNGIITDQDRAMQNAIQIVFPNTRHRWCLWHILKKLPEKFGYHVKKASIFSTIHELVYDSQFVEEFEEGWRAMIDTYELHGNDWLSGLFDNRSCWVPCFLKTTFWAGMSTTQRSESMNAFFDGYVHSKTSLKQFVEQYERALRNKVEKEFQADFKSYSQMVPCTTTFEMEKQFQKCYTISKFREVQAELTGKVYCDLISTTEGNFGTMYEVREVVMHDERRRIKKYFISFKGETCEIVCSCHLFEFRGILCRHAIVVLIRNDVTSLPERYILRRWRRDICRAHTRVALNYDGLVSTPAQLRYADMCREFAEVANLAADDEVRSEAIKEWIFNQKQELGTIKSGSGSNVTSQRNESENNASGSIRDPISSRRKGAPKKLRRKSMLESSSKKARASSTSTKIKRSTSSHNNMPSLAPLVQASPQQQQCLQTPFVHSHLSLGNASIIHALPEHLPTSTFVPSTSTNFIHASQGIELGREFSPSEMAAAVAMSVSVQATSMNEALPSFFGVDKDKVIKCLKFIQNLTNINGTTPNGVLEAACLGSDGRPVESCPNSSHYPNTKRTELDKHHSKTT